MFRGLTSARHLFPLTALAMKSDRKPGYSVHDRSRMQIRIMMHIQAPLPVDNSNYLSPQWPLTVLLSKVSIEYQLRTLVST